MSARRVVNGRPAGLAGLAAGCGIAAIEAWAAGGHVSPVAIVALLLAAAAPMPAVHLTKHLLGLPDTLQPNTLDSVVMMALFALAVSGAGLSGGALLRQAAADPGPGPGTGA